MRAGGVIRNKPGEGGEGGSGGGEGELCRPGEEEGTCTVSGLSWGSVTPAAIKLATERWRPQVLVLDWVGEGVGGGGAGGAF